MRGDTEARPSKSDPRGFSNLRQGSQGYGPAGTKGNPWLRAVPAVQAWRELNCRIRKVRIHFFSDVEVTVAQSCPTLCDPMEGNPPGSSVHGIFRARILGWVAISFSISSEVLNFIENYQISGRKEM